MSILKSLFNRFIWTRDSQARPVTAQAIAMPNDVVEADSDVTGALSVKSTVDPTVEITVELTVDPTMDPTVKSTVTTKGDTSPPKQVSTDVWIYEGDAYDLSSFVKHHPGGGFFVGRMRNRDITTLVNVMHASPEKAKQRLKKYALNRKATGDDVQPKNAAPPFLFKRNFDARRDTPKFNFETDSQLLDRIRARLRSPNMKAKIARMDTAFDIVAVALLCLYFSVQALRLEASAYMPLYLFVPLMAILRISLSGAGHYLNHRPLVGLNGVISAIFDINYVPMAFVVIDGHTLMHHPHTQSEVDIKRNVFTAMMELPRYYRIPIHTFHKIGHVLTGMPTRAIEICQRSLQLGESQFYGASTPRLLHHLGMVIMRVLLLGEVLLFWQQGELVAWLGQFVLTLWMSTFMIVASHNFEEDGVAPLPTDTDDWAAFQVKNALDLTMIGNKYIDCFLSAGLSPHRVHHVLPYQRSGFANIASEAVVREEAEAVGIAWLRPKNFFVERLPSMFRYYLLSPSRLAKDEKLGLLQEHFSKRALKETGSYVYNGFIGIGSV